ncbi:hypothetical protein CQB05_09585 [Paracidovorax citrulli]|nr:hypothetical protein CQB05_09585 [Paracidovorax citrulli]
MPVLQGGGIPPPLHATPQEATMAQQQNEPQRDQQPNAQPQETEQQRNQQQQEREQNTGGSLNQDRGTPQARR